LSTLVRRAALQLLRRLLHRRFPADVDCFALGTHDLVPVQHRVETLDQQLPGGEEA